MKKMILKSALLAIAGVGLMAGTASANLIQNGSFEDTNGTFTDNGVGFETLTAGTSNASDIEGWQVTSGSIDWIDHYWEASDGDKSLDLAGSYANGFIVGTSFETIVGQTYTVQFDMAGNPDNGATSKGLIGAAIGGFGGQSFLFENIGTRLDMGWETKSFSFIAYNTQSQLLFGDTSGVGTAWGATLDNVIVTQTAPVPEPATMLLFGTGLAGLAGLRRKRNKKA